MALLYKKIKLEETSQDGYKSRLTDELSWS